LNNQLDRWRTINPKHLYLSPTVTNLITLATITISVLQTLLIVITLFYTRHHFKLERAASYIVRFNSEDMIRNRAVVESWLEAPTSETEKLAALDKNPELAIRVYTFVNIFQELGVAYRNKMIHRRLVVTLFTIDKQRGGGTQSRTTRDR
jgi:hypothetical protein